MRRTLSEIFAILGLAFMGSAGLLLAGQNQYKGHVLNTPVGENFAVRLFYDPAVSDYFHFPIVFRVADEGDARLITPPSTRAGWTSYVAFSEMRQFLQTLAQSNLTWQESDKVEIFEPAFQIPRSESLEITVVGSTGTARARCRR